MATVTRTGGHGERGEEAEPRPGGIERSGSPEISSVPFEPRVSRRAARRPRRRARRSSTVAVGLGALILTGVTLLAGEISSLNLLNQAKLAIFGLVVATGLASTFWERTRARHADEDERVRNLEAALAGDVTRPLTARSATGVGVRPSRGVFRQYVYGPCDAGLERALRDSWIVCVVGPPGRGKTRAAFEALKRGRPGARLIAPVDGKALETILAAEDDLFIALDRADRRDAAVAHRGESRWSFGSFRRWLPWSYNEVDYVLWLDGLQRFVPTLNVNELLRLIGPPPNEPPKARLVATIREEDLDLLLGAATDESHRVRCLLSHATQVSYESPECPSLNSDASESANSSTNIEPGEIRSLPRRTGRIGFFLPWLAPAVAAIALALVWVTNHGLTVPPAVADQQRAIEASLPTCELAAPARGDDAHYWTVPIEAGSCPGSDFVRIYASDHGHLEPAVTVRPHDLYSYWWFRCGDPSRCAFPAGGTRRMVVGEFVDPGHHALPLVLYRSSDGAIYELAPYLGRFGPGSEGEATLTLTGPAAASWRPGQCGRGSALCGYPATYVAATALNDRRGRVLLIAGYAVGRWYAPTTIITRAFALSYLGSRVVFDRAPCGRGGQPLTVTLRSGLSGDPRSAMIAAWRQQQFISPVEC